MTDYSNLSAVGILSGLSRRGFSTTEIFREALNRAKVSEVRSRGGLSRELISFQRAIRRRVCHGGESGERSIYGTDV